MALGRRGGITALLTAIGLAACSAVDTAGPTSQPAATTTTTTTSTTTIPPVTTTSSLPAASTTAPVSPPPGAEPEVRAPDGEGPFPAVVLVHGGGWVAGDPSSIRALARHLTENGFLTFNIPYQLADRGPGYPGAVDDVACAVAYAAAHPDSDGTVAVVGHSAGAHLSAVIALSGERYGAGCVYDARRVPDRLVGLAGPYDTDRMGLFMLPFFGGGPSVVPEAWEAGNPMNLTTGNPGLSALIMYGGRDALVEASFSIDFHEALVSAGADSTLELVEGARHMDLRDPGWVGDLIVAWLER